MALGLALFVAGLVLSLPRRELPPGRRFVGLALVGASSCLLAAFQPDGAGFAGIYFVMVIGGMRLDRDAAMIVCGGSRRRARRRRSSIDGNPARDRRPAVLGPPVVSDHAADPRGMRDCQNVGAARVARRARRVGRAGRARPRRARAARRARALAVRARAAARGRRGCWRATAAPTPRSSTASSARTSSRERADRGAPGDRRAARRRPARSWQRPRGHVPGRDAHRHRHAARARPRRPGSRSTGRPRRR